MIVLFLDFITIIAVAPTATTIADAIVAIAQTGNDVEVMEALLTTAVDLAWVGRGSAMQSPCMHLPFSLYCHNKIITVRFNS